MSPQESPGGGKSPFLMGVPMCILGAERPH
jgi:hypothetical protein